MSAVDYKNIRKKYGSVEVMQDVSFSIEEGRFVVLLGPSGCGKTTLLRMTAGLEKITGGDILFGGERVNDVHPRDRDIAMVFQSYALYPQMKVYDNIAFSLQVRKESPELIDQRVQEAADILDLNALLDRYPKALSGGQRQRVAMGRALVRHPKVFLFDEPLSNLDAKLRGQMRYEIRRIHDRLKTTTIYVTHDQIEAMTMADEIVVMRDGNVEQMGTPDDIYDKPVNTFVADFIGSPPINFLNSRVRVQGDNKEVQIGDQWLALLSGLPVSDGQEVKVGIRPPDIALEAASSLQGKIEFVENTGAERHLHLRVGEQDVRIVSADRPDCQVGDTVGFSVNAARIHLFDEPTGDRIDVS
ncbi:MAG: sn-glycerol-3-phosphate ABC transporter ATP-binding protein UgpC [Gammaproteobacteria bacterium]|nr:sn-glycerol-3-phosphate ABC transporter ATP-binding protein UgpC [Gammaproteobacteria bacterium]